MKDQFFICKKNW